ncbi:MAG: hypothetical protein B7Y80_17595 [Hyphomicrobium sp. 32-62-53]|nr:MAG: hypothetical protein B7Z29_17210 [Hyphomicrobium sp. 12-62-95]OYX97964.1 MAG: hypothetical protein B7Y80_17595 [Hyphomicrobium sp. 32-62-53]
MIANTRPKSPGAQKRAIIAAVEALGTAVSEVARRHALFASQLVRWRGIFGKQPPPISSQPRLTALGLRSPASAS